MPKRPLVLCVDDEWNGLRDRKMLLGELGAGSSSPPAA
jgi:hypothetical protein